MHFNPHITIRCTSKYVQLCCIRFGSWVKVCQNWAPFLGRDTNCLLQSCWGSQYLCRCKMRSVEKARKSLWKSWQLLLRRAPQSLASNSRNSVYVTIWVILCVFAQDCTTRVHVREFAWQDVTQETYACTFGKPIALENCVNAWINVWDTAYINWNLQIFWQ